MLPRHGENGLLPEGVHQATWTEVVTRFGWTARRVALLARLKPALLHLHDAGCPAVLLGGSFITMKAQPKDIDCVWSIAGVDFTQLHPVFTGPDGIPAIKALFGADMFPSFLIEGTNEERFTEFFQHTRDGRRVGVVVLNLATLDEDDE